MAMIGSIRSRAGGGCHRTPVVLSARWARRMAATVASASASVVDQLLTLMRIAAMPCQVVPPSQAVPSSWTRRTTARVCSSASTASGGQEADEHLVEDDVVEDLDAGRLAQAVGDPPSEPAAALDEVLDAVAAERPERRVDREAAGTTRAVEEPLRAVASASRPATR